MVGEETEVCGGGRTLLDMGKTKTANQKKPPEQQQKTRRLHARTDLQGICVVWRCHRDQMSSKGCTDSLPDLLSMQPVTNRGQSFRV